MAYTDPVRVEWNDEKNHRNQLKHDLSFEEAKRLFLSGVDYLEIFDDLHSDVEDRFIAIGPIARGIILVVWTEGEDEAIRIISARFATMRERRLYQSYLERIND